MFPTIIAQVVGRARMRPADKAPKTSSYFVTNGNNLRELFFDLNVALLGLALFYCSKRIALRV
jgi:hypothetical protein